MKRPGAGTACRRTFLAGAALALALALPIAPAQGQERSYGSGAEAYQKLCGYCHRPEVGVGTALEGRTLPPEFVRAIARYGLNAMPAFPESHIDDETLDEITAYLATLPAAPPPEPDRTGGTP